MSKHNPGPWRIVNNKTIVQEVNGELAPELVAKTFRTANARLIAVAPDLLSIAKAYLVLLNGFEVSPLKEKREQFFARGILGKLISDIEEVIAKAEGEIEP